MARTQFRSTIRYLATGVNPVAFKENADGALDAAGTPSEPIATTLPGDSGDPWIEGLEDPAAPTGLLTSQSPEIAYPELGQESIVGAYEGAVRTRGPASHFPGYEVSGGPWGDQALGRRMMFKLPLVMGNADASYEGRVIDTGYQDELAAAIASNGQGDISDAEVTQSLLLWEGGDG